MTRLLSDNQLELDEEWVELIMRARAKGLTVADVSKALLILKEEGQSILQESAV